MFYEQDTISEVKILNDIVDVVASYVKLTPRSGSFFGLCPFHAEKSPSFSVNRDKQFYYCFGCGAGGNVISFIKKVENLDFPDALKLLADRVHFNLPEKGTGSEHFAAAREATAKINKEAARFYYNTLQETNPEANAARKYLENRGITPVLVRKFGLGFAPEAWDSLLKSLPDISPTSLETAGLVKQGKQGHYDRFRNRIIFPIIDQRQRVIGFGGRNLGKDDDGAKYINSPETALFKKSECLYGLNHAKKARSQEIIIVEGYMDVVAMHMHGFTNTVGVLGTALKNTHARLVKNTGANTAILLLDGDEAGIKATLRAIPVLIKEGLKVKILTLTQAKDPDEYLSRFGAAKFNSLLAEAKTHIAFQVDLFKEKHDISTIEGRVAFTQECARILAALTSTIEIDAYVSDIARATEISPSAINKEIEKLAEQGGISREFLLLPRTSVQKKAGEDIGLKNARKGLLNLLFSHKQAAKALQENALLTAEEIGGGVFGRLLEIAFTNIVNSPSDLFDMFETDEEQQAIAEILADSKEYSTKTALEKALCDMLKKIKLAWLTQRMELERDDLNTVKTLHSQRKSIIELNITLNDG
ncbi:MAG: DNA primase [Defluviitaleaceae bacterium]|nr:DNA primase [Defluviitaleaceae bacterium]